MKRKVDSHAPGSFGGRCHAFGRKVRSYAPHASDKNTNRHHSPDSASPCTLVSALANFSKRHSCPFYRRPLETPLYVYMHTQTLNRAPYSPASCPAYSITQHPPLSFRSPDNRLCRVAASNTSSTPSPVSDEHSRYFLAPILLRTSSPSSGVRNFSLRFRISSCATGSSRKSFFRPTRIMGTPGHRSRTSGCLVLCQWTRFSSWNTAVGHTI